MSERAHPDDPGFKDRFRTAKIFGFIPVRRKVINPYKEALMWRYSLANSLCAGKKVLDVPCGMGWGTSLLSECSELHGVDISEQAIETARRKYFERANFHVGNMGKLEFPDGSFDVVVCLEGIEHVEKAVAEKFLRETRRILIEGGVLILSSPNCNDSPHSGNPYHVYEYQPAEMRTMLCKYFRIDRELQRVVDNLTVTVFYCM